MAVLEAIGELFVTIIFEGALHSIPVKIYEWITGKDTGLNGYRTEQKKFIKFSVAKKFLLTWETDIEHLKYKKADGLVEKKFGETARQDFKIKTKKFTILLREFPEIRTLEIRDRNLRGFQLTKQTRVFYRINSDRIIILTLFDSRQDPKKRPR